LGVLGGYAEKDRKNSGGCGIARVARHSQLPRHSLYPIFHSSFFSLSHNYDHHTVLSDGIPSLVSRDQSSSPHLISLLSFPSPVRSAGHRPLPLLAYPHIARVANSYRLARTSPSPIAQTKGTPGQKDPSYQGSFSSDLSTLYYCISSAVYVHIN
jgi:hypothetical protein